MLRQFSRFGCSMAILATTLPSSAFADPVRILTTVHTGAIELRPSASVAGSIDIRGTRSIHFDAVFESGNSDSLCIPCVPGETISLSSLISPPFLGSLRHQDDGYPFNVHEGGGQIYLNAPAFVLPVSAGSLATFESPFSLGGFLGTFRPADNLWIGLSGTGRVTGVFNVGNFDGQQYYQLRSLSYRFDSNPVPEPATMTLVATGLGLAALRRRRKRASGRDE